MDHFCLCRIRDLYRAILNFEQYFEQHYDLNLNEAMLLCTLSARSSQTAGEVAEALGLTNSNASKVIASAEALKLIKRQMCKDDKRRMRFSLTALGEERLARLQADDIEVPDFCGWTTEVLSERDGDVLPLKADISRKCIV